MKRWTPRQLIALVLGAMLALGINLSVVQAADMAVKMAVVAATGTAAPDGCGGDHETANTGSCIMVCPNACQAVVPVAGPPVTFDASAPQLVGEFPSVGRPSYPDPYPPKPVILI